MHEVDALIAQGPTNPDTAEVVRRRAQGRIPPGPIVEKLGVRSRVNLCGTERRYE